MCRLMQILTKARAMARVLQPKVPLVRRLHLLQKALKNPWKKTIAVVMMMMMIPEMMNLQVLPRLVRSPPVLPRLVRSPPVLPRLVRSPPVLPKLVLSLLVLLKLLPVLLSPLVVLPRVILGLLVFLVLPKPPICL